MVWSHSLFDAGSSTSALNCWSLPFCTVASCYLSPSIPLIFHIALLFPRLSEQLCASKSLSVVARGIIHCDDDTSEALMDVRLVAARVTPFRRKPACYCAKKIFLTKSTLPCPYCTHL